MRAYMLVGLMVIAGLAPPPAARSVAPARFAGGSGPVTVSPTVRQTDSWAPAIAEGRAARLNAFGANTPLTITVALKPRDPAGLAAFARSAADPGSPLYRHFLSYQQIQQRYGPSPGLVGAVADWLRGRGIPNVIARGDSVSFRAPAGQIGGVFDAPIETWRLPGGRVIFGPERAPAVPGNLSAAIAGIVGLDDEARLRPELRFPTPARRHAARSLAGSGPAGGYSPIELRGAYDITSGIASGIDGSNQTIDLYELDGYVPADVTAYDQQYNTGGPVVPYQCQTGSDGAMTCTPNSVMTPLTAIGEQEVEADIEIVQAMAPKTTVHVYQANPATIANQFNLWQAIISAGDARVVSTSWGGCELDQPPGLQQAMDTLFQEAVAGGIGILAASGDNGSVDCHADGLATALDLSVDNPGSDPNVTDVGGTSLMMNSAGTGYGNEIVWNDLPAHAVAFLGSGGGVSALFPAPGYQSGLTPPQLNGAAGRMAPDVSANADVYTPDSVYTQAGWTTLGGTSLAAPLWAAILALANQSLERNGAAPLGFANPTLYALARGPSYHTAFHDIVQGSNDVVPGDTTGTYASTVGFDLASGWGSPDGAALLAALGQNPPRPTPTVTPTVGGPSSGAYWGAIWAIGDVDLYTITPGTSGSAVVASCATSPGDLVTLSIYDAANSPVISATTPASCQWLTFAAGAGQTYIVKTTAQTLLNVSSVTYSSAWSIGGAPVVWQLTWGALPSGGNVTFGFPTISTDTISLSTCGPPGSVFDLLYLKDAGNNVLASSTASSNCQTLTDAPGVRGLYRLAEVAVSGAGTFTGTIITTPPSPTPTATSTSSPTSTSTDTPTSTATTTPTSTVTSTPTSTATTTPIPPISTATTVPPASSTPAPPSTATNTPHLPTAPAPPPAANTPLPPSTATTSPTPPPPTATNTPVERSGQPTATSTPPRRAATGGLTRSAGPLLALDRTAQAVDGGGTLPLRLRTAARARILFTLQVVTVKHVIVGSGKRRRQSARTIVLYRTTLAGVAGLHGQFAVRLRITYKPVRSMHATLTITARTAHGVTVRTIRLIIRPPRRGGAGHASARAARGGRAARVGSPRKP